MGDNKELKKIRLLFVNESLTYGGGEKSLLNLLSALDYEKYDVDLQLFRYGAPWEKYIPSQVNVLQELPYCSFTALSLPNAFKYSIRHGKFKWIYSRLKYSILLRIKTSYGNIQKACLFWKCQSGCFPMVVDKYDYVIAYAQGIPTFYAADKIKAEKKKLAWINVSYKPRGQRAYIQDKYNTIDKIVAVSEVVKEIEEDVFPAFRGKISVFRDLINPLLIVELSKESIEIEKNCGLLTIVTLGRLNHQKGYDIAIAAAAALKSNNIGFRWYILGDGILEQEIRRAIQDHKLEDNVILLGAKTNPYPYLKLADIYVQTSKFEGFGLAIAEARILNIPVVTTRFDAVFMQMVDGKNGLVTDMNGDAIADAIIRLWTDKELYSSIVRYLEFEKKGNMDLITQFDYLIS